MMKSFYTDFIEIIYNAFINIFSFDGEEFYTVHYWNYILNILSIMSTYFFRISLRLLAKKQLKKTLHLLRFISLVMIYVIWDYWAHPGSFWKLCFAEIDANGHGWCHISFLLTSRLNKTQPLKELISQTD